MLVESELLQYLLTIDNAKAISSQVIVIAYIKEFTADKY